jgi:replicative DNA helicase
MQLIRKGQKDGKKYNLRQDEIKQICSDLKDVSVETGLPIIVGAQFNRDVLNAARLHETRIREAADIEHIANLILGFWNNNKKGLSEDELDDLGEQYQPGQDQIFIEKLKHRTGVPGLKGMLSFDGNTGVITNKRSVPTTFDNGKPKISF